LADIPDPVRLVAETIADGDAQADDDSGLPPLTRDDLAAMFAKLVGSGLSLDDLDGA
jgi:hypothetical protein